MLKNGFWNINNPWFGCCSERSQLPEPPCRSLLTGMVGRRGGCAERGDCTEPPPGSGTASKGMVFPAHSRLWAESPVSHLCCWLAHYFPSSLKMKQKSDEASRGKKDRKYWVFSQSDETQNPQPPKPNPLHFQAMPGISLTVCSQRSEPQLLYRTTSYLPPRCPGLFSFDP